ncbi:MAG: S1C family serine protease [bacterium]
MQFLRPKLTSILFLTTALDFFPVRSALAGNSLNDLEREISSLIDSSKLSVVTVASKFSQEVYVEKESSILSFFRTEVEKKAITYVNIGSGIIFDKKGHILTRSSIVLGSASNTVTLSDGVEYPANFVGHDPETGFAVIKIAGDDLKPAYLGNSDTITLGSWLIIIGNSLGVYPSVVLGSINGLRMDGIIQVSANLEPGNNGSPIFNTKGEVIGVVAARLSAHQGIQESFMGYNFSQTILAYPINWIKRIAQDIIQFGRVRKGWLGVIGYPDGSKPKISQVKENSPAHKAGLTVGDVIVRFSGKEVNSISELAHLVEHSIPGRTVTLDYIRAGQRFKVDIEIGEKSVNDVSSSEKSYQTSEYPTFVDKIMKPWQQHYPLNWIEKNQMLETRIINLERELEKLKSMIESN